MTAAWNPGARALEAAARATGYGEEFREAGDAHVTGYKVAEPGETLWSSGGFHLPFLCHPSVPHPLLLPLSSFSLLEGLLSFLPHHSVRLPGPPLAWVRFSGHSDFWWAQQAPSSFSL